MEKEAKAETRNHAKEFKNWVQLIYIPTQLFGVIF